MEQIGILNRRCITLMAPGLVDDAQYSVVGAEKAPPKSIFPDGLKLGPTPSTIRRVKPYEDFPNHIAGDTLWDANDYKDRPEAWIHRLTEDEIAELGDAADRFKAAGIPLTGISKVCISSDGNCGCC